MRIIDTHLHLIELDRFSYPWLDTVPPLKKDHTLDMYLAEARPLGIEAMLHMEVDVAESDMEAETDHVTGLGRGVIGAIAACRPEKPGFAAFLDRIAANPKVRGLRRVLHVVPDELPRTALFRDNLRLLPRHGLSFDIVMRPDQLPTAHAIASACPDVQFILDHCGNPDVKSRPWKPWADHVRDLAALPNVAAKISGIVTHARPETWTADDLRPYVEHVIASFGWDRVVWGSDWPVCTLTGTLTRWVEATKAIVADASEDERARLFHRNAERIYRLTPA